MSGHLYIRNEPAQVYIDRIIDEIVDKKLKSMLEKYIGKSGQVCQLQSGGGSMNLKEPMVSVNEDIRYCRRHGKVDVKQCWNNLKFPYYAMSEIMFCPVCFLEMLDGSCCVLTDEEEQSE